MLDQIKTTLRHCTKLTVLVTGDDEKLSVVIIADPKTDIKVQPILVKGTYEEVKAELPAALDEVFSKNDTLLTNAKVVSEGLKKAAENKANVTKKKASKGTADKDKGMFDKTKEDEAEEVEENDEETAEETVEEQSADTEVVEEVPENSAEKPAKTRKPKEEKKETKSKAQLDAEKKAKELLEKAIQSKDSDMVAFLRKQATALYDKAKFSEEDTAAMNKEFLKYEVAVDISEAKAAQATQIVEDPKEQIIEQTPPVDEKVVEDQPEVIEEEKEQKVTTEPVPPAAPEEEEEDIF